MRKKNFRKFWLGFAEALLLATAVSLPLSSVSAATEPYQAEVSTGAVTLAPGATKTITLKFKNIGTKTWTRGKNATAVFLYGDTTVFSNATWLKKDLPALIREVSVKPGAMASAVFEITAPATPGTYSERFLLSSGPNAWIKGSVVNVTFTVAKPAPVVQPVSIKTPPATATDAIPSSSVYKAELTDKGGIEWQLEPGEQTTVNVKFKNVGSATWKKQGAGYLSLYTWEPKYRASAFKDSSWGTEAQAAFLVEKEVKTGQTGTMKLVLRAPEKPGTYTESFQLASEDTAWVDGGSVTLKIRVTGADGFIDTAVPPTEGTTPPGGSYSSVLLLTSHKAVTVAGSGRMKLTHGFKNAGDVIWNSRALRLVGVAPALGVYSNVRDESWPTTTEPVKEQSVTSPGEIGFVSYTLKAPAKMGDYQVTFQLTADGRDVEGGEVSIPVTVTSDGYVDPTPIPVPGPVVGVPPLSGDEASLPAEPIIRVGLFRTTDDLMKVRGITDGMKATQKGNVICAFAAGEIATASFDRTTKLYRLTGPNCTSQSTEWYVMEAQDGSSPLEITDYSRPVSWLPGANDNKFRAKLELRFTPETDNVWVINELLLESYLYGIAETSNVSPLEYQKALLAAARTYALYHVNRGTKHADEFFHVDAHLDQVYRGYGQEERSPNIVDGVVKTRGQIVTYDGKLAITPYFSRSDGRTRDWTEVWGGKGYAWLKSVPVPHDVGQTLWGHGVGLSARGALYMASKDNATYDAILKHFYQGTELRKAYK
ncbi:hypothetical protein HY479_03140 [Candidatus Uhrbacteria bacterium]|nr:hypothetical protein [Candidatus Uhrbacteria bacterium]